METIFIKFVELFGICVLLWATIYGTYTIRKQDKEFEKLYKQ